jgi:hypothetical protein
MNRFTLYAPDGVLWGTRSPNVRDEPAELRAYFEGAFKAVPDAKVTFGEQLIRVYGHDAAINTGYYRSLVSSESGRGQR